MEREGEERGGRQIFMNFREREIEREARKRSEREGERGREK